MSADTTKLAAAAIERLMAGIDPRHGTAVELAAAYATADGSPIARCYGLIHFFEEAIAKLADPKTPGAERAACEADVREHWALVRGQTSFAGARKRRLAWLMGLVARAEAQQNPGAAEFLFVELLGTVEEQALRRVNATALALVHECARVWGRSAGAPHARDRRRSKWDVLADLHKALGFGECKPTDLKKECSPSRR